MADKKHWLSPSSLGLFVECNRCFWLERNSKIKRPGSPFSTLPNGIDKLLKAHYDNARSQGQLPPEIQGQVPDKCRLYGDQATLNRLRNWQTGLKVEGGTWVMGGALDDLLVDDLGIFTVYDYKTHGYGPKEGDTLKYYGRQADCYALLLETNQHPAARRAYFAYYMPRSAYIIPMEARLGLVFEARVIEIPADPARGRALAEAAATCLSGPLPPSHTDCETCGYLETRREHDTGLPV